MKTIMTAEDLYFGYSYKPEKRIMDEDDFKKALAKHDQEIKDMIDEIDHLIDCADNASEVADEFKAMGCTCGRDRFVKEIRSKL